MDFQLGVGRPQSAKKRKRKRRSDRYVAPRRRRKASGLVRFVAGVILAICATATGGVIWFAVSESGRSSEAEGVVTGLVEMRRSNQAIVAFRLPGGESRTARMPQDVLPERKVGERVRIQYVIDDRRLVTNAWMADSIPNARWITFLCLATLGSVAHNAYAWRFNRELDRR